MSSSPTTGPEGHNAELDAFGKGKGKGKGDGRCHNCNGEVHFARDRPSTPPVSPKLSSVSAAAARETTDSSARQQTKEDKDWMDRAKGKQMASTKARDMAKAQARDGAKAKEPEKEHQLLV